VKGRESISSWKKEGKLTGFGANGVFLEFGDFGIAELFLLNLEWLLKQRHHLEVLA